MNSESQMRFTDVFENITICNPVRLFRSSRETCNYNFSVCIGFEECFIEYSITIIITGS